MTAGAPECYALLRNMAVAARDPKLAEYAELLCDFSRPVSELELRRILRELKGMSARAPDHETVAFLYNYQAICHQRLGQPQKALDDYRRALQRLREPTHARATALSNQATALMGLNRYQEAALSGLEASQIPEGYTYAILGNLAVALYYLGETDAASQTFQEALRLADLTDPLHCFTMAAQAAVLGLDQDAVDLFARFILRRNGAEEEGRSSIEVIATASEEDNVGLKNVRALDATIRRMTAMAAELSRLSAQHNVEDNEASSGEVSDVYEATRRLREEALAHALLG